MFNVDEISELVMNGGRVSEEEALHLYREADIYTLGRMANSIRERLHGDRTYYNINRHIDPTNVCAYQCTFCAYARPEGDPEGFTMTADEVVERARGVLSDRITELHLVGGCHPSKGIKYYADIFRALKREFPRVHLKTLTAVEIVHIAEIENVSCEEVLRQLHEAGLDSLPGGGAEIFADRVRTEVCAEKADADQWLEVHRIAHRMGLRSNATMLYGHVERDDEVIDHLIRLRDLQDETGGFQTFIPLAYHADYTTLGGDHTGGLLDLRTMAISRIVLDNFPHIKAYWIMLGLKLSQLALSFGASDIDGTVAEEIITHEAGARTPQLVPEEELIRIIHGAGRVAVERDTHYNVLRVHERPAESTPAGVPA